MANHAHPRRKNYEVWAGNVAGLLFFLVAIPCTGQTPGTTVSGLITSVAGTPVANAAIAIKNRTANQTINLTSNVDGSYALQNLALGRYEITASAPGYAPAVITVTLTAGSSPREAAHYGTRLRQPPTPAFVRIVVPLARALLNRYIVFVIV